MWSQAREGEGFVSRGASGGKIDAIAGDVEGFGQEKNQCVVGLSLDWWCLEANFEGSGMDPDDLIFGGVGDHPDDKRHSIRGGLQPGHGGLWGGRAGLKSFRSHF